MLLAAVSVVVGARRLLSRRFSLFGRERIRVLGVATPGTPSTPPRSLASLRTAAAFSTTELTSLDPTTPAASDNESIASPPLTPPLFTPASPESTMSPERCDRPRSPLLSGHMGLRKPERYQRLASKRQSGPGAAEDRDQDGDHSILSAQALAWRAAMQVSAEEDGGAPVTELRVQALLEAFAHTLRIGEIFGPLMSLGVKNDEANFAKVRGACSSLGQHAESSTLRDLLEAERDSGVHGNGDALADPSAGIALVWMHRSLSFTNAVLEGLNADRSSAVSVAAREAYKVRPS